MARGFNLTAQINLQGPSNIKPVIAKIKRELGTISTNLDIKFDSKVAKNVQNLTGRLGGLNTVLSETNRNSRDLATTLSSLSSAFSSLGSASKTVSGISRTAQSVNSTAKAVKTATTEMAEFGKQSALAIRRFAAFSVVTSGVFSLINAINSGTQAFIKFDQEIIKLRQITGAGTIGIKELENEITNLAINLGVSSEKLASVAIVLAQAGLSAKETRIALAALAKTELAPSFENIEQTTEGAIAALRQFDIEVVDLEKALGSINAVAAAFAVESSDIVAAIQRAGGAFAASSKGVSTGIDALNEFISVFTSVRATTRESAETIATGLRTIFTRIQRGSTVKFLEEFGVQLTDIEGKFVGPFEAVRRLSEVLNTLDPRDLRFAQIVEELGGFRQIGKVIPLIQQFSEAQKALGVAQRGQSSLAENQVTAQLALANQIARVREEFLALVRAIGQSQTFQVLFKTILGITSGLIKLASVFKPILPLLTILGGIKGFSALSQFAGGFIGGIRRAGGAANAGESIGSSLSGATDRTRSEATERATSALSSNTDSLKTLTSAIETLTQAINTKLGGSGTTLNQGGRVLGFARGGSVPGSGRGDKVPALLEPNEYVLNRKTAQRIGKSRLDSINNKYAFGGKVKDLAEYYSSIPFRRGYEDIANQPIKDNSTFTEVLPSSLSEQEILEWRGSNEPRWKKFENLLASKYRGLGSPAPERFALLDFPESRSEAKFMKRNDTYSDPDSIKGNNDATIAAKNFLYENSLLSGQKNIKPSELVTRAIASKPVTTYWADPDKFQKAGLFSSGGLVQRFANGSPGGVRSTANMVRGARGSNIFWKGFRLPLSYEDIATLSTAELLDYGRSNEFLDYLSSGGSGIAVKKLVKLPDTLTQEEIDAFGSDIIKKADGYYSEVEDIYKFRKAKKSASRTTEASKLGREQALAKQVSRYADEVAARDQRWTSISDNSPIDRYLSSSLEDPILSDYKTVRGGGSLTKAFHNTRLRQAVNKALDNYDDFDYGSSNIDKLVSGMAAKRFADGGLVRNFRAGGIQEPLSLEEAKKQSAGEIVSELSSAKAKEILEQYWSGTIPPDPNKPSKITKQPSPKEALDASKVKEWNRKYAGSEFLAKINEAREALYEAYQKKVNTRRGASAPLSGTQIQAATQSGLLFGVAGMYGNGFPPRKLELVPGQTQDEAINKLKGPVTVSLVGGVLARNEAEKQKRFQAQIAAAKGLENLGDRSLDLETSPTQEELSQKFGEKASLYAIQKANKDRAINYVNAIAKSLDPSSGGSQIFLDFDKTLAFGADKITRLDAAGRPDYSAFSDPDEIKKGLSAAKLSRLGTRLKDLVRQSDQQQSGLGSELLNRMFVVSARPPQTMDLIAQWLQNKGLNIPSSNVVGVGGAGKSPNDIAISKAEEILSRLSGNRSIFIDDDLRNIDTARTKGLRAVQYGANIDKKAIKDAQDREGTSFEKFVRENLPPDLVRAMTSQTGESIDYPKGLGETVAAWFNQPLLSSIPTDVKRTVSGIGKVKSNIANYLRKTLGYKLGGQVYDLQPDTGLSDYEFNQLVKFGNTNDFTIDEFKKYLDQYLKQKKDRSDLRLDPMSLLRAITPERSSATQRQTDLARQLMGEPDAQYRPRRYAKGGHVNAMLTPGEAVISPQMAKKIGYAKLDKMNYADKNGMNKYAFGGGVSIVPGTGNGDSFGPVPLPVGSYVIRKKATEALGFNKGGSVGTIQKFAGGRRVGVIAEDRRLADLFKQLAANIRGGMTSSDAFDRVVESARTDFPEAANLLREAAESFKSGADPAAVFAPFGGELARLAGDAFASGGLDSDAFDRLSSIVNKAADTMDLFSIEATDAGSSLQTFENNLKKRLQEQILGRESQRRSSRIDLGRQIIRSRSTDVTDPTAIADTLDQLRTPLTALIGSLEGVDPADIDSTLQAIISGSAAGESLQDLRDRLPLLNQAFDNTIDRTTALADIEAEAVSALGGLTASVRSTIEELDALDYQKSGRAREEFGAAGELNPAATLRFRRSAVGGGLLRASQSFQELSFVPVVGKSLSGLNKVLGQLPGPIGNAVRAIGGLPGALAAVASIIGTNLLPQLGEFLGLAEDANFAGLAGGVAEGGSFAVSLGTIGQQVGGQIGSLIGTIGGAIVGFFKGFTDAFRRQQLTNALKGLTAATDAAKVALDNLSKYDSAENAQAVQKATIQTEVAARKLEDLSQRTVGERAVDTGIYAGAGLVVAGILAAALAPITGGLSLLATAGILGTGAAAGAVYGGTRGPTEMDDEALKSYLDSLTSINDTLGTLAQRDIKFKSLEDLNKIIDGFIDSSGAIDTGALGRQSEYIRQAQEGALRAAGFTISSTENLESQLRTLGSGAQQLAEATAAQFAYQAGLEELNRQLNGNLVAVRAATDTEEERQAITRRGFERIGEERRQLALQQRLALVARQVTIETESLVDIYNKLLSAVQRYNDTLNQTDSAIANATDILLNQRNLNRTSRSDQAVLQNARAYSIDELDKVLQRVADLAGGGERGQQLTDAVRGRRIVEDQLPQILRNVTQRNIGDVTTGIVDLFAKAGIGREVTNALIDEIENVLESETGSRQGKSFDELVQQFPSLQKAMETMEKANESAIALLEAQSNLYDKVVDRLNAYSDAIQKSTEWTLRAADIRIQSENELAKALGRSVSLDNLNKAFNQQIESLTRDLANGLQGTTNPAEISGRIRANQRAFEANQRAIREQPSTPQGRQTVTDLLKQQEKLKTSSANLYQALEKLATSGDNASNALNKLQERRQISENATDLLERVFTQGAEEADRMFRSFGALQDALSGRLMFGNQNERVLAFEGLRTLLPLLSSEIGNQLRAAILESMLKGNGINVNDTLIPGIGGQGKFTYQDILNNLRNPEADPATKALIDSYLQANELMRNAATEISRLNQEAADKFLQATDRLLSIPLPGLGDQANVGGGGINQIASDIRTFTNAATQRGSIYTHDTHNEELLRQLVSRNNSNNNGPIIGANNLDNINLPVFEKISTILPDINTELLNVVKSFEIFNTRIADLSQIMTNLINSNNKNNTGAGTRSAESLSIDFTTFSNATKEFGGYIARLERIKFPEKITMGGSYTLDVRVSGAAAFQSLEEKTRNIIDAEISREIAQLEERIARSTGYSVDPRRREP